MNNVTLTNFQIIHPPHRLEQERTQDWILAKHQESVRASQQEVQADLEKFFRRYSVKPDLIATRYFECPDIAPEGSDTGTRIYDVHANQLSGSPIGQRNSFFAERALERFREFYRDEKGELGHIIHVTCTGYRSPSAVQRIIAEKNWGRTVGLTHAYHMGCYAAMPAIRMADAMALRMNARVDIVHTEMCGLHMNAADHSPEQIVVQTLFADGHVKYSATPSSQDVHGLEVLAIQEEVVEDSADSMTWAPEAWGLSMTLSREVPARIGGSIMGFFESMAHKANLEPGPLLKDAIFAIHPGGPKIITSVQERLGLQDSQVQASQEILRTRGNMSSATLPHVWKSILDSQPERGKYVVSFAFGPGLTIFGAIFRIV